MADMDYEDLLAKLQAALEKSESEDIHIFDKAEVDTIRNMIDSYRMFLNWGRLGKVIIWMLITTAAGLTALSKIKGWEW